MKKIKNIGIILLIGILIFAGIYGYRNFKVTHEMETLTSNIEENISNIVELSTVKYNYTNIGEFKDSMKFSGIDLPFTQKTFLVKYSGYIKAGSEFEDMVFKVKSPDSIEVNMGEMKILDNVIIEEEVYFYNEKDSAFNRLKLDDLLTLLKDEKKDMEKEVLEKGILKDAKDNGEMVIKSSLLNMGFKEIKFINE